MNAFAAPEELLADQVRVCGVVEARIEVGRQQGTPAVEPGVVVSAGVLLAPLPAGSDEAEPRRRRAVLIASDERSRIFQIGQRDFREILPRGIGDKAPADGISALAGPLTLFLVRLVRATEGPFVDQRQLVKGLRLGRED